MVLFIQILILSLALLSLYTLITEISRIYAKNKIKGKIYILCIPETNNIEDLCFELNDKYRNKGYGEDILICKEKLSEDAKNIGSLIETTDKGIYLIDTEELIRIIN